ncbi:MAG: glycoside hydrolase family 2 protein, partial [Candidatus Kapaibacteriota bacterium]
YLVALLLMMAVPACAVRIEQDTQGSITVGENVRPFLDLRGAWLVRNDDALPSPDSSRTPIPKRTIAIPSNWFTQGIDTAEILVFERRFRLSAKPTEDLFSLVFEGIDYEADITLNGIPLGKHTGYFQPFAFRISDALRWNDDNILRVRVSSPKEAPEDWSLRKRLIKGIFGHHDTRPGGAWSVRGQDANTGGIWGNVYITAARAVDIERVGITPLLSETHYTTHPDASQHETTIHPVKVALKTTLWANAPQYVTLRYAAQRVGTILSDSVVTSHLLQRGRNVIFDTITILKPALWHTHDVGTPHLYRLTTEVLPKNSALPVVARADKFGIRSIRYDKSSGIWYLNGRRIFLRGTNYIGTQFLSTMNRPEYDRDAVMMRSANINIVRVHAHIARKEWYDACDSLGLLVWQDFPLQWGYADDASFVQTASAQVRDMITLLGNHPSIGAWCLQNEPPFDADWMQYKYPNYQPLQNRSLNLILTHIAQNLDSRRYVHPFSATSEHRWEGWYFGAWTDYAKPTKERLITEFGAQALPNLATMQTIPGIAATLPATDSAWAAWEYHNFQRHETFDIAKVQTGKSIDEFIRNSQEHQVNVTTLAAESYRLQRFAPVGAIFQFMFVEAWASMNWAVVDYRRIPKPAYFALAEVYQPILIATTFDSLQGKLHITIINDSWRSSLGSQLSYTLETPILTSLSRTATINLGSDTIQQCAVVQLPSSGKYTFRAVLRSSFGDTLSVRTKPIYFNTVTKNKQ